MDLLTHVVMGPSVPAEEQYAKQRYFVRGLRSLSAAKSTLSRGACAEVYRSANDDYVQLSIEAIQSANGLPVGAASAKVFMNPGNLRDLAERLLDAAADLERYPSAVLLAGDLRQGAIAEV